MCEHEPADSPPTQQANLVEVPLTQKANGNQGKRGISRNLRAEMERQNLNPYAPRASDFLSNISNFSIIESTLRGIYLIHYINDPFFFFF